MKLLLVINLEDYMKDFYEDFKVDYDLRATLKDDRKINESIRYVENCPLVEEVNYVRNNKETD